MPQLSSAKQWHIFCSQEEGVTSLALSKEDDGGNSKSTC
jgi:hypothetical protein